MNSNRIPFLTGLGAIALSLLACEPIFVIGTNELLILFIIIGILLGPPLFRWLARKSEHQRRRKQ
jgi:hypothetical protein